MGGGGGVASGQSGVSSSGVGHGSRFQVSWGPGKDHDDKKNTKRGRIERERDLLWNSYLKKKNILMLFSWYHKVKEWIDQ